MNIDGFVYPAGIVYADKDIEVNGDYQKLAFLSFQTLILEFYNCPQSSKEVILSDAKQIQVQKGKEYQISSTGQKVILGYDLH